jgi:hypothetical protein
MTKLLSIQGLALLAGLLAPLAASAAPPQSKHAAWQEEQLEPVPGPVPGPLHDGYVDPQADVCCNCQCQQCCCDNGWLEAGFAFTFLQPHFESSVGLISNRTDNNTFSRTSDSSFEHDFDLSPRVWLEYSGGGGLGIRASYWEFDHDSPGLFATPADAGQTIAPPEIPGLDVTGLRTNIVGELFSARSALELDVIDLEGTKWVHFECWSLAASGGLRYAGVAQNYSAVLVDNDNDPIGTLDAAHRFDGIGPTMSIEARRRLCGLTLFSQTRGALLFGNGKSDVFQAEGLDTATPFSTLVSRNRNDVMAVGELQLGFEWATYSCNGSRFYTRCALEGQIWQGAGTPTGEDGDLGLFGLSVALGMTL